MHYRADVACPLATRLDASATSPWSGLANARSANERLGSGTAHGNGTAFSAVAPSERPVLPSIDPIMIQLFGSGILQARMVI